MKRIVTLLTSFFLFLLTAAGQPKYVFYFIGDGMGVNQVCGTETYLAAIEGNIGYKQLCFTTFPYATMAYTYSATNGVTDSAASGTALACGEKTKNGCLGVLKDAHTPMHSIAEWAAQSGAAVGIATSVSVDHATPAAFYAHVPKRQMYYEIGEQLPRTGYQFFAGSDFLKPINPSDSTDNLYLQCQTAGYTIARGYKDYRQQAAKAERIILLQSQKASDVYRDALPYAIDRQKADLTLADITRAGINFLSQKADDKGFFLMVEGGKIDWACHSNDAGTLFREIIDMDQAVRVAYEWYQQHPDETLIVITADHETGGLALGTGPYELHLSNLAHQKMSTYAYTNHIKQMRQQYARNLTWDVMKQDLQDNWGFWSKINLTEHQTARLQKAYDTLMSGMAKGSQTLYQTDDALCDAARRTMAETCLISWASTGHSNGLVPVFAIGSGAEQFAGIMNNIDIPLRIAAAADWSPSSERGQ